MTSSRRSTAVDAISARAAARSHRDRQRVVAIAGDQADEVVDGLLRHGRLTVNFHPDRRDRHGRTVVEGLLADGRYRTQFDTGISNGSRSALAGGQRVAFERGVFGNIDLNPRPVYGTLDITHDPHGGAPSFGSSALVLADHVKRHTTFTAGDSHLGPVDVGTVDRFDAVAAAVLEGCLARDITDTDVIDIALRGPVPCAPARDLSHYVEAQVHGELSLDDDVVAVLMDPAFRDTPTAETCTALAERHELELRWHGGTIADVDAIPADFHGEAAVQLGHALARADGTITAREIGAFAAALPWEPQQPGGDPRDHPLQTVKYLWQGALVWGHDLEP